jgi:ABC-type dipeptide/oligopeptide/nickel transport system permease component
MAETKISPKIPNTIALAFYSLMLLAGITLWLGWGILYNNWFDPGVYSISIVLLGFGFLGVLLYGKK